MNLKIVLKLSFFTFLVLLIFPVSFVFAQSSELSVQVLASGLSVINPEPEFTQGFENTINWSDAELAVEYYVEASTDGSFGVVNDSSGWISLLNYTFANLDDDTKYYYRVKSRNSGNTEGPWSEIVFSTQDNNAPTSKVLDLADEINTSSFTINISSFDQTSGVYQITLMYRKDGGAWIVYGNYNSVSSIVFNSNLTGGDGFYEFYTIATDIVGNVEYEVAHTDTSTHINTIVPTPAAKKFVLIETFGGIVVSDFDIITTFDTSPIVTGYSQSLKKIIWEIEDSNGKTVATDYVRSNENGFWEAQFPGLLYGNYSAEFYFVEDGIKYSDSLFFTIEKSVAVTASGYSFPNSPISVFYNNTWFGLGTTNDLGFFDFEFEVPYSYVGEIIFKSSFGEYFTKMTKDYSAGKSFENLLFPPILYPSSQFVPLNKPVNVNGYAVPNSKMSLYIGGDFYETTETDSSGNFIFRVGKFVELKQFQITAKQEVNETVSEFSDPVFIYVHRHNIPYIHTVGSLVERHFGSIARLSLLISEILTIVGLAMTVFSGLLISSASTISGYYYLLHDWKSLCAFLKPREKLKIQIAGVDMGNREGLLYLYNPTSSKVVSRILIDSKGVGYTKKRKGIFNACYIATRNASWVGSAILRRTYVRSYILDQLSIKASAKKVNIVFDESEDLFFYPFSNFEKWFDRLLLFVVLPISISATVVSILAFYFIASYSSMVLIFLGFGLIISNALMIGYRKTVVEKIHAPASLRS